MTSWSREVLDACSQLAAEIGAFTEKAWVHLARRRFPKVPSDAEVQRRLSRSVRALPTSETPLVSVIIPVYGKFATTYWCLDSLSNTQCQTPYEVIVVDDASPDTTAEMLTRFEGVRTLRNVENLGFVRSCNAGAAQAKGEFLCFLNNDTRVSEAWLDQLVRTFRDFPGAGLVGGMLLFPDGILQEAGGSVFKNGTCSHYGRNRSATRPEYNYVRPVDYCSGACLLIRRSVFTQLGGFDLRYVPAYYEDTDLAFRVRELGLEVLYQPLCKVVHFEGVTHGRNPNLGMKRYQTLNRDKFVERWRDPLQAHSAAGNRTWSAGERRLKAGLLVVLETELPALSSPLGKLLMEVRALGQRTALLCSVNFSPSLGEAWQAHGIELVPARHVARFAVSRLREPAWSARYAHIGFDSSTSARSLASRVRRLAPHLKQWLIPAASPAQVAVNPEFVGFVDGVLNKAENLSD